MARGFYISYKPELVAFEMLIHRVHDVQMPQKPWLVSTILNDLGNCGRRELGVLLPTPRARSHRWNEC